MGCCGRMYVQKWTCSDKIMGIDTKCEKGERALMLRRPGKMESDVETSEVGRVSIRLRNSPYRSEVCHAVRENEDRKTGGRGANGKVNSKGKKLRSCRIDLLWLRRRGHHIYRTQHACGPSVLPFVVVVVVEERNAQRAAGPRIRRLF